MSLLKVKFFALILLMFVSMSAAIYSNGTTKRNIMYYADWSIWGGQGNYHPEDMPSHMYTHLNYAFLDFDTKGNLLFIDKGAAAEAGLNKPNVMWGDINAGILPAFRALRAQNPNVKIGVSVGGWTKSGDFSDMAANASARKNFVDSMIKFVEYAGMDFIDIDWEYPGVIREPDVVDVRGDEGTPNSKPADKANYIKLLQELRAGLDALGKKFGKKYELSVSLPMDRDKIDAGVDVPAMFKLLDFANMMTYDGRGSFDEVSGHHTALYGNPADPKYDKGYSIDQVIKHMISRGAPRSKLVVGVAFYTRGWEEVDNVEIVDGLPGLFSDAAFVNTDSDGNMSRGAKNDAPVKKGDGGRHIGVWALRNLKALHKKYPKLKEYWDDTAKAPYLYNGKAFFTLDNERSITEKTKYVNDNGLGGVITWMASNDDGKKQRSKFTSAIFKGLYGRDRLPHLEIIEGDLDIYVTVSATSVGYDITIQNNEVLSERSDVLSTVEKQRKTIMLPKIYIDNSSVKLSAANPLLTKVSQSGQYSVVDLASQKYIRPGGSVTVKLKTSGSVSDLYSIKMTQRTSTASPEMSEQIIYTR